MKKIDRNSPQWIKKPYPHVWIVLFRYGAAEDFEVHCAARGGLDAVAYKTKKEAQQVCSDIRRYHGKRNAYVQMYGPIS